MALLCNFISFKTEPQICTEQRSTDFTSIDHTGKLPATPYMHVHAQGQHNPFGQSLVWFDLAVLSAATSTTPTDVVFSNVIIPLFYRSTFFFFFGKQNFTLAMLFDLSVLTD